ncbi:LysR family transcriptional regulator [Novosphingobium sp. Leaf2]|uniref:LysR family transcriptional regulator n=1 Tax=Novosphingobium sp. Leaf2 TaxID=1735670 RepID=UPI00138ED7A8|nr:LysR family transcriptional regulator [Novosphingobium sp. Leaf2]
MRIDPAKLRHLVAVVDAGSFAKAAQTISISQPAISKSIKALEDAVGNRLFERGRAGARPTPHCELLVAHARAILAEYGLAAAELHALSKADTQQLAIGASLSLAQSVLPRAISRFRQRWPEATVSVDVGFSAPLLDGLLAGDLDLVLSAPEDGVKIDDRLQQTFLLEERDALVVGAAHPLLRHDSVTIAQLLEYPWIVPRRSGRLDRIHAVFAAHRLPPPAYVLRSESADLARGLLQEEPFICLMGEGVLRADLASGTVAALPALGFEQRRAAFLFMRRSTRPLTAARNLAAVLHDVAKAFN